MTERPANPAEHAPVRGLSRRGVLGLAATGGLGLGAGIAIGALATPGPANTEAFDFYGAHQQGVTTPVQDHLHFAALNLDADATREDVISLLQDWSYAAARITQGLDVSASGAVGGHPSAPPDDTGEAIGLPPSRLTITIGLGPGVFERDGVDRFGLADRRPPELADLPPFLGDALNQTYTGADLCIQACSDDPQVAVHAIRNLTRIGFGRTSIRWSQVGFGRTSRTTTEQSTPRNLMGFKDGTRNILAENTGAVHDHVWVGAGGEPAWMRGGTYLVARKIAMLIEPWDRVSLGEQEMVIGRTKGSGAPLSGGEEFTEPDFNAEDSAGNPLIDMAAHVRLAHPDHNRGVRLLRRGYNYVDGNNELGRLDAGLFFLSFQSSIEQFVTVQRSLAPDLLNEYIRHVGSAVFAIPPGAPEGGWVGAGLFS